MHFKAFLLSFTKNKKVKKKHFTFQKNESIMQNTTRKSARCSKAKLWQSSLQIIQKDFNYILGGNLIVALLVLLIGAVIVDLSVTRIPNFLILSGLIGGIFYRVLCLGERNYLVILLGILIPVFLFFPLFLIRAMGAGDIKLFAVTGAFFTIGENLKCIVFSILLGGIFALIKVLFYRNLRERLKYMFTYFGNVLRFAGAGSFYGFSYMDQKDTETVKSAGIKFSLPVLIAAIIVMGDKL